MLGRNTELRQGNLLTDEDAHVLGLVESLDSGKRVVVISHDCDLLNDAEEFIEVIVSSSIPEPDPMYANARNPRRLHLSFLSEDGEQIHIELRHTGRQQVAKAEIAKIQSGDATFALSADEKRTLKQWLAARYGRPAFPNAFENRLRKTVGKRSVEYRIAKILAPASSHLVALFIDLGEEKTVELADGDPYFLSISVVYDATEGGLKARESADKVASELRTLCANVSETPSPR